MNIAVTAASGQLGQTIIKELLKSGDHRIVAVARTPEKVQMEGVEVRKGDYTVASDWPSALEGMDAVLIVSANGNPADRVDWHRNIIEGAKQSSVKKVVYTSIIGASEGTAFSPVVLSNRQTEEDIQNSGLDWSIGRNGLYIEPDFEYIDTYQKDGGISNCAGEGKCSYTSREELAVAYAHMLVDSGSDNRVFHLCGEAITQKQLADTMNEVFGTALSYRAVSVEEYTRERKEALGEFMGTIIAGIYSSIGDGVLDVASDYEDAVGRPHKSAKAMALSFIDSNK